MYTFFFALILGLFQLVSARALAVTIDNGCSDSGACSCTYSNTDIYGTATPEFQCQLKFYISYKGNGKCEIISYDYDRNGRLFELTINKQRLSNLLSPADIYIDPATALSCVAPSYNGYVYTGDNTNYCNKSNFKIGDVLDCKGTSEGGSFRYVATFEYGAKAATLKPRCVFYPDGGVLCSNPEHANSVVE